MSDSNSHSSRVVSWFKNLVRPVFQKTETAPVLEELDKLASQVEELDKHKGLLFPICLLGQAGVGKSTLINTLIADTDIVVPSGGGTGPLTANALRVIYGERPSFVVRYHSTKQLGQTRFILEAEIHRQAKIEAPVETEAGDDPEIIAIGLDDEVQKKTRTEEAIGRACLLVAGAQTAHRELTYLADAFRWVLGQASKFQTQILEEDMERLRGRHSKEFTYVLSGSASKAVCLDDLIFLDKDLEKRLRAILRQNLHKKSEKSLISKARDALVNNIIRINRKGNQITRQVGQRSLNDITS